MQQTVVTVKNASILGEEGINLIQEDMPDSEDQTIEADSSDEEKATGSVRGSQRGSINNVVYKEDYEVPPFLWNWEVITEWKKRIEKYTDQQKKFYSDMVPRIHELTNVIESPSDLGWTLLADDKENDIYIELKKSVRGLQLMRARGTINAPPKEVYRCCMYIPFRQLWDVNNDFLLLKKKIGVNAYIAHIKTKKKFVIAARDFVVNYLIQETTNGAITMVTSSDDCEFTVPEISGVVRAYTALSGFILKPHPNDPN